MNKQIEGRTGNISQKVGKDKDINVIIAKLWDMKDRSRISKKQVPRKREKQKMKR